MSLALLDQLRQWLDNGLQRIGQIAILTPDTWQEHHFGLCHVDDLPAALTQPSPLIAHHGYDAARTLMLTNDSGEYRPLRSSPDLRHGWLLHLDSVEDLRRSLDYFYPAALGMWRDHIAHPLKPQHFRDKLARQTGMYRSAKRIGNPRASKLIHRICNPQSGCLKLILWNLDESTPIPNLPPAKQPTHPSQTTPTEIPLLCKEACNILVAEARKEARKEVTEIS